MTEVMYDIEAMEVDIAALNAAIKGAPEALWGAFYFDQTPQGVGYWRGRCRGHESHYIDDLKEIRRQYLAWRAAKAAAVNQPKITPPVMIFGEDHTLSDIVRWIMSNRSDAEEIHRMLGEALAGNDG